MKRPEKRRRKVDLRMDTLPSDNPIQTRGVEPNQMGRTGNEAILQQMRDRMNQAHDWWNPIYTMSREDVAFAYDDQWPQYAKKGRKNRPMLTMNMLPEYIHQVMGQARKSKFSIHIRQTAGKNDTFVATDGNSKYTRSQVIEGCIRDIESRSKAHRAYCRAMQHAVEGGIGWLRVRTVRPDDDPFNIDLRLEHVKDRYSVVMDPFAELEDYSDARYGGIGLDMPEEEFRAQWPDVPPSGWKPDYPGRRANEGAYWSGQNRFVRVVDYWWKEPMKRTALDMVKRDPETDGFDRLVLYKDEVEEVLDELKDEGFEIRDEMEIDGQKVKYMRTIWNHILDGPHDWPSMHLPIIPVLGRHINLAKNDLYVGLTRFSKDPQRMYNFWASSATEKIALAPKAPFILTADSISGHEDMWNNMQTSNKPYLLWNYEEGVPPPSQNQAITLATGELQLLQQSKMALQDSIGMHDASLGKRSNEVSGVALQERQDQGSNSTYEFVDNLASAVKSGGDILADMIPRIYTSEVARDIVLPDDTTVSILLNHPVRDKETGKMFKVNTLDFARFSCRATAGPASATQREEFVNMMMEWGRSDPEGFPTFRDLIIENLDIPNGRVIAERMKMMVPRQFLSPEDAAKLPPPQPTPEQMLAAKELDVRQIEAEAKIAKAQADMEIAKERVKADEARTQFEVEKGLNREEQEAANGQEDDSVSKAEVEALIKRAVAQAMAAKKAA